MKGKRTITSLQSAADDELARAKIEVSRLANEADVNLDALDSLAADYRFLFNDLQQIAWKPADDFLALVKLRIAEHKEAEQKRLDAERERIRQEESAKLKAAEEKAPEVPAGTAAIARQSDEEIAYEQLVPVNGIREPHFTQPTVRADRVVLHDIKVTITRKEYDDLLAESRMLAALMAAGVDQWSGYDEARESLGLAESADHPF
jgi:hypothetical protein